jgi:GMP synthase (glutamine-hydrolysing)
VNVLAVVHGANCPPGAFRAELERLGHDVDEWSLAWGSPPPRPIDNYGAVMIFGGSMHADQEDHHPWLRDEQLFLQRLLDLRMPLLGVCLGSQLIAKAAHADVSALETPEVGWVDVELTDEAADDPVFSALPERFPAFQWHFYGFDVPAGAVELARSESGAQIFRLGDVAWGVLFHPEITRPILETWLAEAPEELPVTAEEFLAAYDEHAEEWQALGALLCGGFIEAAERIAVPV